MESVYIYGSVALGDFIEGSSDIDFITILREPPSMSDIETISAAHQAVEREFPHADIMGAYLSIQDVGKAQSEQNFFLTYFNKQVHSNGYGADLNPITWWILKNHGMKVYGAEQSFSYEVKTEDLLQYVIENLNTYWVSWIRRLEEQSTLLGTADPESVAKRLDTAVEWCTLGMLRQLYTLKEHDIRSKVQAGYYGMTTIPQQWHGLIHEAISIKRLRPDRVYDSHEKRLTDLIALLRYIHQEANRVFVERL
ncbi:aminoglycoside adenylyltransferase domain-containing protein [Paenibacillus hodogayensis]|uniref:Aminoglycoside adenylyltransferase domain-containing protein n=1 Tax=Paenibacillus hodogayensis TaxID=279208 RepID=A0ABV5VYN3_9BACL